MGWATVVSCDVACHVMSTDVVVTSFDAMWLLVLRHVTWCMRCHGDELLTVVPCNRLECYELKMPLVVRSRRVVRSVTMRWSKELLCTTLYYKVLLQYYSVLRQYYKVLLQYYKELPLQYYSVLQGTMPVLQRTTQYYNVLLQYYNVLLQYYSVLQGTIPVLYSVLQGTTPVLQTTTQYYSSTTLYYKVLLRQCYKVLLQYYQILLYYKVLLRYYFEALFTMCGATGTLQLHQILRLPRHMNLITHLRDIWNVSCNARNN